MKIIIRTLSALVLLAMGFAAGFPAGKSSGFETGSEWALKQADVLAREAGVFMPVYLSEGNFRVVIRQPRGLYKRAWQLADRHEEQQSMEQGNTPRDLAYLEYERGIPSSGSSALPVPHIEKRGSREARKITVTYLF